MTHIAVSLYDKVCESLVTLMTEHKNVPLLMTLLVMFLNNGLIAAYFVALCPLLIQTYCQCVYQDSDFF